MVVNTNLISLLHLSASFPHAEIAIENLVFHFFHFYGNKKV